MNELCDLDFLLEKYAAYLCRERRYADSTVSHYRQMLSQYAAFVKAGGVRSFLAPAASELLCFLEGLRHGKKPERRLSPRTLALHIIVLRGFYQWLAGNGHTTAQAARAVRQLETPKIETPVSFVMSPEQMTKLLDAPRGLYKYRDKAILEVAYSTGARVSELVNMQLSDLDLSTGQIRCKVKSGKERVLFLGRFAAASIILYLTECRPRMVRNNPASPWLFVRRQGDGAKLPRGCVNVITGKYGREIGLGAKVTPHTIRRSAATHFLMRGADLRAVMDYLGHVAVSSTQRYLRLDPTRLRETHANYHPHGVNGNTPALAGTPSRPLADSVRWPDVTLAVALDTAGPPAAVLDHQAAGGGAEQGGGAAKRKSGAGV